jgi:hypothetical protein
MSVPAGDPVELLASYAPASETYDEAVKRTAVPGRPQCRYWGQWRGMISMSLPAA